MSAKTVELSKSSILDFSTKSQDFFGKGKSSKNEFRIGVPRPNLPNDWWTTFTSIPASENPLNPFNDLGIDDIRQPGPVHFLGGVFGSTSIEPVERDVVVAKDQSVVFPILNIALDNVGWNFFDSNKPNYLGNFPGITNLYQFPANELRIIADAIMDTAKDVSLVLNGNYNDPLITNNNADQYRQASQGTYILKLPAEDDILGYRGYYPDAWIKPPYTRSVQDGIWVELENLLFGENTIHFTGTLDFGDIVVQDYDNRGGIGNTPLEYLLSLFQGSDNSLSIDVTYNVDVVSRPSFNAQLSMW